MQKVPGINLVEYLPVGPVCYVVNPKAASRTIIHSLVKWKTGIGGHSDDFYWSHVEICSARKFRRQVVGLELFTVVRDEEDRLFSCWKDKLQSRDNRGRIKQQYFVFYWPFLYYGMDYECFRRRIAIIPNWLSEKHFMSQQTWLRIGTCDYAKVFSVDDLGECQSWLAARLPGFKLGEKLNTRKNPRK